MVESLSVITLAAPSSSRQKNQALSRQDSMIFITKGSRWNSNRDKSGTRARIFAFSTDTLTNKTIDPTDNTMPYLSSYTYTVCIDGGKVKARNNKTGSIEFSDVNLDPVITSILGSGDASFEVMSGTYNLPGSFSGWNAVNAMTVFFHQDSVVKVPNAYTGYVWNFGTSTKYCSLLGGRYGEQGGTPASDWTCIKFSPADPHGTLFNTIKDVTTVQCKYVLHFLTDNGSWINSNHFENVLGDGCKYLMYFEHTGAFTPQTSGCNGNYFEHCVLQSHGSTPQVLGGVVGVNGYYNKFDNCLIWDIVDSNASAPSMTITKKAGSTMVKGGILTHSNYEDDGTDTRIDDPYQGLLNPQIRFNKQMSIVGGTIPDKMITFLANKTMDFNGRLLFNMFYDFGDPSLGVDLFKVYDQSYEFLYKFGVSTLAQDTILKLPVMKANGEWLTTTGHFQISTRELTTTVTLGNTDARVRANAESKAFTINLPTAADIDGRIYSIKKTDTTTNIVTIEGNNTETIEGLITWELRSPGEYVTIISDGTNWAVVDFCTMELAAVRRTGTTAPNRHYVAGAVNQSTLATTAAVKANSLYAMPFTVDRVLTIDSVGVHLTNQVSSSNVRMGIYKDSNGVPNALVADLGTVGTTNPTGLKEITGLLQKLQPGMYWLAAVFSHTPSISFLSASAISSVFGVSSAAAVNTGINVSFTYAALPSTYPTVVVSAATSQPAFFYHFSG